MKVLWLLILSTTMSFSQEIELDSINGYMKNKFLKKTDNFPITIVGMKNTNKEILMKLRFRPKITSYEIVLDSAQQKQLLQGMQKYVEWRKIAIENNVTNYKDISTISIQSVYESALNETVTNGSMTLIFSSTNAKTHLLNMKVNKLSSKKTGIDVAPKLFYIDYLGVLTLEKLLKDNFSNKINEALQKQKKVDGLFQ